MPVPAVVAAQGPRLVRVEDEKAHGMSGSPLLDLASDRYFSSSIHGASRSFRLTRLSQRTDGPDLSLLQHFCLQLVREAAQVL